MRMSTSCLLIQSQTAPDHHRLTLSPTTGEAGPEDGNVTSPGDKKTDTMHISLSCYLSLEKSKNYSPMGWPSLA